MPDVATLVRITDVHKHFTRGSERIDVLKGVNLEIPQGDFLALMGPSGSGKTTLLNLMGGLDRPTAGSVDVGGVPITTLGGSSLSKWRSQNEKPECLIPALLCWSPLEVRWERSHLLTNAVLQTNKSPASNSRTRFFPNTASGG